MPEQPSLFDTAEDMDENQAPHGSEKPASTHAASRTASERPLRVLHSSDWHLGRLLYGQKRYEEFEAFLDWMQVQIVEQSVDILLIAGDLFDTTTPSNRAQSLYYRFLNRVSASSCRHVVIIGGNHDSPSFLNAPAQLLKALDVHVVGAACDDPADEVVLLRDGSGQPEAIICAVPYLRDRDIRQAEAGESLEDKDRKLVIGIREHYAKVCAAADQLRTELEVQVPLIGMGHLFAAGGKTLEGDGVRDLYVGSLAQVGVDAFPECLDYVALGHLHVPQAVAGCEYIRYSGSPLAMGFGEARQQKSLCLIEFEGRRPSLSLLNIPRFQRLERIKGDQAALESALDQLAEESEAIWLEVLYEGEQVAADLRLWLEQRVEGTELSLLRVRNNRVVDRILSRSGEEETLDDLKPTEVFDRALAAHQIPDAQQAELKRLFNGLLQEMAEQDHRAE
ncbi:exonuclease SbcCD subunit D C-terminal domain-containing protein [Marinobacterium sediminicola]|uniref:Nuclease SbcCD subunit D n=1 Tax=Marinobacterium sediminicola TaxID=518898 RepID=A0ABY1RWJ5_9GAMM|nr:exonuclease SbcCD subunit D C-terminal domain-containing protein [Marinobacterium sediminicola]ULG70377.1 exonuclease SbcCD subunit D C-terminal domain-containing protein [Marinobacterium sediminicola]SMR69569.1 Exodeoxyribonuclease I subunit D [Marinobacterium sediminicola]